MKALNSKKIKKKAIFSLLCFILLIGIMSIFCFKHSNYHIIAVADRKKGSKYNSKYQIFKKVSSWILKSRIDRKKVKPEKESKYYEESYYKNRVIELVPINIYSKEIPIANIGTFTFPYKGDRVFLKLRNLIQNSAGNKWFFFESTNSDKNWDCLEICLDKGKNKYIFNKLISDEKIVINSFENEPKGNLVDFHEPDICRLSSIDDKYNYLMFNQGYLINISKKTANSLSFLPSNTADNALLDNNLEFSWGIFINKKRIALQWMTFPDCKNYLSIIEANNVNLKTLNVGYGPAHNRWIYILQIDVDKNREKVAFLTTVKRNKEELNNEERISLKILETDNMLIKELIDIPIHYRLLPSNTGIITILKWSPNNISSLLALDNIANIKSDETNLFVINEKTNKIVRSKSKNFKTKSLRWSPDGKKIGLLSWDGALYVYDIEKDTLDKIAEDQDYFDFFWVNYEKNFMEKALDKVKSFFDK